VDGVRLLTANHTSTSSGSVKVVVDVTSSESAMLLTAQPAAGTAFVSKLSHDGQEVFDASTLWEQTFSQTNGAFSSTAVSLNWPFNPNDELTAGTWAFEVRTSEGGVPTTLQLAIKPDADLTTGALAINLVYAGGTDEDPVIVQAVDDALVIWADLYDELGVDLTFTTQTADAASTLSTPGGEYAALYEQISAGSPLRTIDLVIAWDVEFVQPIYGIAGDIPGPLVGTGKSAVVTSMLYGAGPDGVFSEEEIRLLGETMAHETLHYAGLFHPVEITYDHWDNLSDTPDCTGQADCIESLGDNLMFPFPVCGIVTCMAQDTVTTDQITLTNRYTGVE